MTLVAPWGRAGRGGTTVKRLIPSRGAVCGAGRVLAMGCRGGRGVWAAPRPAWWRGTWWDTDALAEHRPSRGTHGIGTSKVLSPWGPQWGIQHQAGCPGLPAPSAPTQSLHPGVTFVCPHPVPHSVARKPPARRLRAGRKSPRGFYDSLLRSQPPSSCLRSPGTPTQRHSPAWDPLPGLEHTYAAGTALAWGCCGGWPWGWSQIPCLGAMLDMGAWP